MNWTRAKQTKQFTCESIRRASSCSVEFVSRKLVQMVYGLNSMPDLGPGAVGGPINAD